MYLSLGGNKIKNKSCFYFRQTVGYSGSSCHKEISVVPSVVYKDGVYTIWTLTPFIEYKDGGNNSSTSSL